MRLQGKIREAGNKHKEKRIWSWPLIISSFNDNSPLEDTSFLLFVMLFTICFLNYWRLSISVVRTVLSLIFGVLSLIFLSECWKDKWMTTVSLESPPYWNRLSFDFLFVLLSWLYPVILILSSIILNIFLLSIYCVFLFKFSNYLWYFKIIFTNIWIPGKFKDLPGIL